MKENPGERKITQSDINAAQRGLRMLTMSKDELHEIITANNPLNMFAGAVTVAAAKQMLAGKLRVGLLKKNPANKSGVKIVYNKLLGAWYIVRGAHHTPISGAFSSKAEAQAHMMKKNPAKKKPRSKIPVFQVQVLRNKSWIKSVGLPHRWVKLNDMTSESGAVAMAKHYKLIWPVDTIRVIKK